MSQNSQNSQTLKVIPAEEITNRFDKIEGKIDKISDAMISLARNEEKIIAIQEHIGQHSNRLNRHAEKIDALERSASTNAFTSKIVWSAIVAIVVAVIGFATGIK